MFYFLKKFSDNKKNYFFPIQNRLDMQILLKNNSHTFVEIVNPGGTESPSFPISARLEPLPPKIFFELKFFFGFLQLKLNTNFSNYAPSNFEKSIKLS